MFATVEATEKQEDREHEGQDLLDFDESAVITSEKLESAVKRLEVQLQEKPKNKPLKKTVFALRKDLLPRLQKYEVQQEILGDRNSFSKTERSKRY